MSERNSECWYVSSCKDDCNTCATFYQMNWQMQHSGLPKAKQKAIALYLLDDVDEKAFNKLAEIRKGIVDFVEQGKNLYICSEYTGNGKTSWAIKMLHTYFHYTAVGNYENLKGMFVSTTNLLLQLKDFNNPLPKKYLDNLKTVDLVVWDDIALSNMSQYDYLQFYNIIDQRILAEKSNIFTTNCCSIDELAKLVGAKTASRIYYTSEIIELKGKDNR